MSWALADVEARASKYASFEIPGRAKREALRVGDLAKLVFVDLQIHDGASGERMWVEIVRVVAGRYRGRLRNAPVVIDGLEEGALVDFGPEHVADWEVGK